MDRGQCPITPKGFDLKALFGKSGWSTIIGAVVASMVVGFGQARGAQPGTYFASQTPPSAMVQNNVASTPKVKNFNVLGAGVAGSGFSGTCFGETCNASSGNCFCEQFSGTTKAPLLGKSTWTASFTENDNDTTATGNGGHCFPSEGELVISSSKGSIAAEVSGPGCQNFLGGTIFVFQYGQAFKIDPTLSTGVAAGRNGGGSFSLSDDISGGGFVSMSANGFYQ
jgi:hypothetical protein